ncbi:HIT domain-containing protein [Candidatus Thiothrix anitrata]|jgi:diadenosine tetraphosphate (Ap4A) HIT family hydrolase|uniref:HIT domain-containing protein n=1 Tax=Candidatus Thiothrix anitrata TaxID=2823902 RepID=A0ABX7X738_9GAMM|nr:HIT domain-containing protein [Candidatus Thiothrix anitrata]QTR50723.1 HIT domain-containing protein [Candidatus Thiothrix anitrata]
MKPAFSLHPQLAQDTHFVTDLPLCRVLLMNEARYPWCILVPRRAQCREIHDLSVSERTQLWAESDQMSQALMFLFQPDKLNMAALGNVVSQLHLHHIARFQADAAWPAPVWGKFPPQAYHPDAAASRIQALQEVFD